MVIILVDVHAHCPSYSHRTPISLYPFHSSPVSSSTVTVDFALAVRSVPATTPVTIERARTLPLTLSSPAVLLGLHATNGDQDGSVISTQELSELSAVMTPHVRVYQHFRLYEDRATVLGDIHVNTTPTLFCTLIKPGFLHLLAFSQDGLDGTRASLIDTLPLSLYAKTSRQLVDRLRIVIALFTLQREVVKISEMWGSICWPHDVLVEDHLAVVEATGLSTPTPSDVPSSHAPSWVWKDQFDSGLEDDPEVMKKLGVRSAKKVSAWLAHRDAPDTNIPLVQSDVDCPIY